MKKLCAVVFGVCVMSGAFSGTYTWTGAAGDGLWTTAGNWEPAVKGGPASADIIFPVGDWTIRMDGDPYYYSFTLEEGSGTVTFVGTGTFKAATTVSIIIPEGRELCFDGPSIALPKEVPMAGGVLRIKSGLVSRQGEEGWIGGDGKVIVEGGRLSSSESLSITNNMELVILRWYGLV